MITYAKSNVLKMKTRESTKIWIKILILSVLDVKKGWLWMITSSKRIWKVYYLMLLNVIEGRRDKNSRFTIAKETKNYRKRTMIFWHFGLTNISSWMILFNKSDNTCFSLLVFSPTNHQNSAHIYVKEKDENISEFFYFYRLPSFCRLGYFLSNRLIYQEKD